jgi:hypothetical protein
MSDAEPLATISCAYGETVEYPNELPTYTTTKIGFTTYYNLFSGWDKSTAGVAEDLDVVALWENGNYGNVIVSENDIYSFISGFDTRELNASQIYSIIQNGLVVDLFGEFTDVDIVSNFDRVRIPLGNRFNYVNRVKTSLIPEGPMIFDGNQEEGYDTGVKLFEDDTKDWTLFLDIQYINAIKDAAMVSCYSGAVGFEILNSNENSQYAYPYVTYCGNNSNITNTNTGSLREVFVLTHKGGYYKPNGEYVDPVFTVYQGSLNKLQPTKKVVNKGSEIDFKTSENTLVLGGRREEISANRFRWLRKASGIIHHCDMWNELLSESECMELAYWPREDAEFTAVSFGSYYDENGKKTNIDLMPAQAAPAKVPTFETYNDIPTNYSFNETYTRRWMHERYYNALPITWKALIKNTRVPSSEYTKSTSSISVVPKLNKLYSPSQIEMAFDVDSYPGLEKEGRINPLLGYKDEYGVGTYDGIKYNRRFAPSMPTFDVAPSGLTGSAITPSWIYTEQPTEAVANGSI